MGIIYKAVNVKNGKSYIGFTSKRLEERKNQHKYAFKKGKTKFYAAIRKYGWDVFSWEILYEHDDDEYCLTVMEPKFILEANSIRSGYNMIPGGDNVGRRPGALNGMYGKTHTVEAKEIFSKRAKLTFSGKSYEEMYGLEKSLELRSRRKANAQGKNNKGIGNPRFDSVEYLFSNSDGRVFLGTRFDFYNTHDVNKTGVHELIKAKSKSHRGWKIIR